MRADTLKMSEQEKQTFSYELSNLFYKYGLTIQAESYLDTPFLKVSDRNGNWNVVEINENKAVQVHETDFWD